MRKELLCNAAPAASCLVKEKKKRKKTITPDTQVVNRLGFLSDYWRRLASSADTTRGLLVCLMPWSFLCWSPHGPMPRHALELVLTERWHIVFSLYRKECGSVCFPRKPHESEDECPLKRWQSKQKPMTHWGRKKIPGYTSLISKAH